jgi:hypothetical protein
MTIITVPPPPDMKASDKLAWIIHATNNAPKPFCPLLHFTNDVTTRWEPGNPSIPIRFYYRIRQLNFYLAGLPGTLRKNVILQVYSGILNAKFFDCGVSQWGPYAAGANA